MIYLHEGAFSETSWGTSIILTSFVLSMAVNTLVTGLIVFKILKVFLEVKAVTTSVERTLGTTGGTKLRHVIFVIIESGMALFAIQLVRVVLYNITVPVQSEEFQVFATIYNIFIVTNEVFNVIIRYSFSFVLLITFTWLGHHTNNNFSAGLNEIVLR
jgi:hypothetical protein